MAKTKLPSDLRRNRRAILEKSLALSLGIFLLAFLSWQSVEIAAFAGTPGPKIFEVIDIPETKQVKKTPPPARPFVPVEAPPDELPPEDPPHITTNIEEYVPPDTAPLMEELPPEEYWWAEEMPELLYYSPPYYPELAQKAGLECDVIIYILVDENGKPAKVDVAAPCGKAGFNEAAEEAAWKCRFTPGKQNDTPVRVWISIPFRFRLR